MPFLYVVSQSMSVGSVGIEKEERRKDCALL